MVLVRFVLDCLELVYYCGVRALCVTRLSDRFIVCCLVCLDFGVWFGWFMGLMFLVFGGVGVPRRVVLDLVWVVLRAVRFRWVSRDLGCTFGWYLGCLLLFRCNLPFLSVV